MKEILKTRKAKLSVSIIASNEEVNIKRCLESVKSMADEIVLVYNDTYDSTVRISREYGASCYEVKWQGYRDQKNISLLKTSNQWVLCLDADEEVSPELRDSIKETLTHERLDDYNGYYFNRCTFFLGRWIKHGDWYPDKKLRLVKKTKSEWRGNNEHEKLFVNGKVKHLDGDLLHYSYPTMKSLISKIPHFSHFYLEREIIKGGSFKLSNVLIRPPWRFIRAYFLKLGFLDGFPGFFIAVSTAFSTFFKYSQIFEIKFKNK
jgi:glycosyltransferase involved in cell wall biosynthesis